jgi:hypothetical protein
MTKPESPNQTRMTNDRMKIWDQPDFEISVKHRLSHAAKPQADDGARVRSFGHSSFGFDSGILVSSFWFGRSPALTESAS